MKILNFRSLLTLPHGVLFLVWLLFGAYYLNRFNFSPIIPLLKADLGISNASAGGLMAFFFASYTIFQLPAGYLGDRFGPRRTLTMGALISIMGNLIFSQGSSLLVLSMGQLANGMGQALGWSSAIKLVVSWFPKSKRGWVIGLFITCVTAGSSLGIRLSGYLGDHMGWRSAFILPPVVLGAVTLVFWVLVRDTPSAKGLPDFDDERHLEEKLFNHAQRGIITVLRHRTLWVVALVYFCFVYVQFGCLVWIPTYLKENYDLSVNIASTTAALVLLPGILASPLAGYFSDTYYGGRRKPLIICSLGLLSAATLLLAVGVQYAVAVILLAAVGLSILMPDILLAAYSADFFSRKLAATAMGFLATFSSAAGIITTPVSGMIIDLFQSYHALFFSFAVMAFLGALLASCINETQPEHKYLENRPDSS